MSEPNRERVEELAAAIAALEPTESCGHLSRDFNGNCWTCADEQRRREDMARAWREGAITALDFATRNEDGVTLSLDLDAHPNPYTTPPAINTPARRGSEGES